MSESASKSSRDDQRDHVDEVQTEGKNIPKSRDKEDRNMPRRGHRIKVVGLSRRRRWCRRSARGSSMLGGAMGGRPATTLGTPTPGTSILLLGFRFARLRSRSFPRFGSSTRRGATARVSRGSGTRREAYRATGGTKTAPTTARRLHLFGTISSPVARFAAVQANIRSRRSAGPMSLLLEQGEGVSLRNRIRGDVRTSRRGGNISESTGRSASILGAGAGRGPLQLIFLLTVGVGSGGADVSVAKR